MSTYQFQGHDIVAPFRLSSNEPVFSSDSVSLKVRRVRQGAQRWELEFGLILQDSSSFIADSVSTFHDAQTMEMPQLNVRGTTISQGTSTVPVTVNGFHSAGETEVALASANGTIAKGRFIKFANHDKLYLVTALYSGTGDISIYPALVSNVPTATAFLYRDSGDSITFTAYRDISNVQGITFTDGILSDAGTINLIEAL